SRRAVSRASPQAAASQPHPGLRQESPDRGISGPGHRRLQSLLVPRDSDPVRQEGDVALPPPAATLAARVTTPAGPIVGIFGRGPGADLTIAVGRGLSRRAGVITAVADGVLIANISRTHALYTEGEGYRIRLPRLEDGTDPSGGWFLRAGSTLTGSRAMLDE